MRKILRLPGLLFLFAACLTAAPQENPPQKTDKPDLSKEAAVIESYITSDQLQNDGTDHREVNVRVRVQSDAGVKQYSILKFAYSSASERMKIVYIRVHQPDGTEVETPESSIQDMTSAVTQAAPEYSDLREKHAAVKGLVPGSVLEYRVDDDLFAPLIPGQFLMAYDFTKTGIIEDEEVRTDVPKDRPLKVKSNYVQPTIEDHGDRRIYTWKSSNMDHKELPPHLAGQLPPPDLELSTFQTWEEVGEWWAGLERPQMEPTDEIRAKAAELTKGLTTDPEKVRALYEYVAQQFHYISISFGIGRYKPHSAQEILKNAYGDCKDKHTLLASLLKAVGIDAWPVLIGSSRELDPDVPSPAQFDHVITAVPLNGKLLWMDTTSELAPMGLLVFPTRGKQALLISGNEPPHLAETPKEPPEESLTSFSMDGKLTEDGEFDGKVRRTTTGDLSLLTRLAFRAVSQSQWKDLAQGISYGSGFGGTVSNVQASAPDDPDHPFSFSYDYNRKQVPDWQNHRMTAPLPGVGLPTVSEEKEKADFPIILGIPVKADFTAKVELPKGYTTTAPDDVDMDRAYATYHSHYSFENGVLRAERHFVLKTSLITPDQRKNYKQFRKTVSDDENQYIIFRSPGEATAGIPRSPDFKKALAEAGEKLMNRDLAGAIVSMQHATELDPKSAIAWRELGRLQGMASHTDESVTALRKSIALAPKDPASYEILYTALVTANREEEADQVLRDGIAALPENGRLRGILTHTLMSQKKYLDAASLIEDGIKFNSTEPKTYISLGNAYAKAGESDKAVTAYEKAAALDPSPDTWNSVGYELAVANLKIPEAEHFTRMAVEGIESDTSKITLDSLSDKDLDYMGSLSAYWDTLAWVFYREGKLQDALKYAEASWNLWPASVIADHLAQIEDKLGQTREAASHYAFAVVLGEGSTYRFDAYGGRPYVNPEMARIKGRLEALVGKKNAKAAIQDKNFQLARMRSYTFPKGKTPNGSADFFVLIAPGPKVLEVKFVSGSEALKPAAKAISSIHFRQPFPDNASSHVLRRGLASCVKSVPVCDFVLYDLGDVHSVK